MQAINFVLWAGLAGAAIGTVWGWASVPEPPKFPPGVVQEVTAQTSPTLLKDWGRHGYERISLELRSAGGLVQAMPDCDTVKRVTFDSIHSVPPRNIAALVECTNGTLFKVYPKSLMVEARHTPAPSKERSLEQRRPLELQSVDCRHAHGFSITEGSVKNRSAKPLHDVAVVAQWYDAAGRFISSDSALVAFDPILPAQASPFKVIGRYNPLQSRCRVDFHELMGGTIPHDH